MVRLILFDIDGTLIRTGGAGVKAFGRTFDLAFGLPRAAEALNFSGRTDSGLIRESFRSHGIAESPANFRRFFDHYVFCLDDMLRRLPGGHCPGVADFLQLAGAANPRPLLGLLTGNIRLGAEIKLRHYELWDYFQTGAFGDDDEDRSQIAAIAKKRGEKLLQRELDGAEILVIGDTPLDIACARAIGARALAVGTGVFTREQLLAHEPDWAVDNLVEHLPQRFLA